MFRGRIDQKGFAKGYLVACAPIAIFGAVSAVLTNVLHLTLRDIATSYGDGAFWMSMAVIAIFSLYMLVFFYPVTVGLCMRRWRDMGQPGWFGLIQLFLTIGLFVALFQMLYPGESETNEYGQPESPRGLRDIFFGGMPQSVQPTSPQSTGVLSQQPGAPNENRPD